MMKPNKKAKWIVGITGTTLSAFILSQLDTNAASKSQNNQPVAYQTQVSANNSNISSDREQKLVSKDLSNFTGESNAKKKSTNQSANTVKKSTINQSANTVKKSTINQSTDTVKKSTINQSTDTVKKSTTKQSTDTVEKSTTKQSTDTVKKSPTKQSTSKPASRPTTQPSQPSKPSKPAPDTTVDQPVVQQPVAPPTDRNTSRS